MSDTLARWHRAGEEVGTLGLLQVVFHWLWIPTGRTLAIRFTDKNQQPLLSLQSVFVRNWFGAGKDKILSLSFPTLRHLEKVERGNVVGEGKNKSRSWQG